MIFNRRYRVLKFVRARWFCPGSARLSLKRHYPFPVLLVVEGTAIKHFKNSKKTHLWGTCWDGAVSESNLASSAAFDCGSCHFHRWKCEPFGWSSLASWKRHRPETFLLPKQRPNRLAARTVSTAMSAYVTNRLVCSVVSPTLKT